MATPCPPGLAAQLTRAANLPYVGFFFRKSFGKGPLRINISKSGIGWSLGIPGLRFGRSSTGRRYTRAGIPGTGVGWQSSGKSGCVLTLAAMLGVVTTAVALLSRWLA